MASKSISPTKKVSKKDSSKTKERSSKTDCSSNKTNESFVTRDELEELLRIVIRNQNATVKRISNLEREVGNLYGYDDRTCCEDEEETFLCKSEETDENNRVNKVRLVRGLPLDYETIRKHFMFIDV